MKKNLFGFENPELEFQKKNLSFLSDGSFYIIVLGRIFEIPRYGSMRKPCDGSFNINDGSRRWRVKNNVKNENA